MRAKSIPYYQEKHQEEVFTKEPSQSLLLRNMQKGWQFSKSQFEVLAHDARNLWLHSVLQLGGTQTHTSLLKTITSLEAVYPWSNCLQKSRRGTTWQKILSNIQRASKKSAWFHVPTDSPQKALDLGYDLCSVDHLCSVFNTVPA